MKRPSFRDDDGNRVAAGDSVLFCYGIPPVPVVAKVAKRAGRLVVLTPGHTPAQSPLRSLRRYVCCWYKAEKAT